MPVVWSLRVGKASHDEAPAKQQSKISVENKRGHERVPVDGRRITRHASCAVGKHHVLLDASTEDSTKSIASHIHIVRLKF